MDLHQVTGFDAQLMMLMLVNAWSFVYIQNRITLQMRVDVLQSS